MIVTELEDKIDILNNHSVLHSINVKWFELIEDGSKLTIACAKYKPV